MQKEQDVVRLAKWMTEHPKIRRRICEDEYMVSPEEFIDIMELLEKNEFYEMIYVLLVRNQTNPVLEQATSRIVMESACQEWERMGPEALRREFTANVSHELKTPLTSILGTAEILENNMVQPVDIPHFAGNIRRETERLIGLVNDIIKLSRLDEGGPAGTWETVDLHQLAGRVLEQLADAAKRKDVTLELRGETALARGVPQIVEEVVYNLCDNAVAYNRQGGSVTVTVENTPQGARVAVADTGIGIPRDAQSRVFERFYRVDKSHSSGGTGLGLSIVKHGAAYLGARVELESEPGRGSTFTLTFPPMKA